MGIRRGEITTNIIRNGLVFNMDAANRVSYVPNATTNKNTINLSQTGSFINDTAFISPPISASCFSLDGTDAYISEQSTTEITSLGDSMTIQCFFKQNMIINYISHLIFHSRKYNDLWNM